MDSFTEIENGAQGGAMGVNSLPEPTQAQKLAGNYKMGRVTVHGLSVAIENPRNTYRSGVDSSGKAWSNRMAAHYGYFSGTKGADGDGIDVFLGHVPESERVFVINQINPKSGSFDEHKIMLCFPDLFSAKAAYLHSYDRGWDGLGSIVEISLTQLKWWIKHGNKQIPLSIKTLPVEGYMTQGISWANGENGGMPLNSTLDSVLYGIRQDDHGQGLIFDSLTLAEVLDDADEYAMLDAMVVSFAKIEQKMNVLLELMRRSGNEVKATALQISDPFKQRGVSNVAALFELSDGQTITAFFHNPDVNPSKLGATDELISWKWMLNKKDITIVVAPEKGTDLNPREVARRMIKLAEKNSKSFKAVNAKRSERMANIEALKEGVAQKEIELARLQTELEEKKAKREAEKATELAKNITLYSIGKSKKNTVKISMIGVADGEKVYQCDMANDGTGTHTRGHINDVMEWLSGMLFVGGGSYDKVRATLKLVSGEDVLKVEVASPVASVENSSAPQIKINGTFGDLSLSDQLKDKGFLSVVKGDKVFLGKLNKATGNAVTQQYANNTQANNAVEKLSAAGFNAHVTAKHPFCVVINSFSPSVSEKDVTELNEGFANPPRVEKVVGDGDAGQESAEVLPKALLFSEVTAQTMQKVNEIKAVLSTDANRIQGIPTNLGWITMNAARPLLGDKVIQDGEFLNGRHYAAIDPSGAMASRYIDENVKLDASVVFFAGEGIQAMMALQETEYKDAYMEMGEQERKTAVEPLIERLHGRKYGELVALREAALAKPSEAKAVEAMIAQAVQNPIEHEAWTLPVEEIKEMSQANYEEIHAKLESENFHAENLVFQAARIGTDAQYQEARVLLQHIGTPNDESISVDDYRSRRGALNDALYKISKGLSESFITENEGKELDARTEILNKKVEELSEYYTRKLASRLGIKMPPVNGYVNYLAMEKAIMSNHPDDIEAAFVGLIEDEVVSASIPVPEVVNEPLKKFEDDEQASYKPFSANSLKMPTAEQLGVGASSKGILRLFKDASEAQVDGWTNGHVLDVFSEPPLITEAQKAIEEGSGKVAWLDYARVEQIVNQAKAHSVPLAPVASYEYTADEGSKRYAAIAALQGKSAIDIKSVVIGNEAENLALHINKFYFAYFVRTYKGAEFFTDKDGGNVLVKHRNKIVGVLMPIRLKGQSTGREDNAENMARAKQASAQVEAEKEVDVTPNEVKEPIEIDLMMDIDRAAAMGYQAGLTGQGSIPDGLKDELRDAWNIGFKKGKDEAEKSVINHKYPIGFKWESAEYHTGLITREVVAHRSDGGYEVANNGKEAGAFGNEILSESMLDQDVEFAPKAIEDFQRREEDRKQEAIKETEKQAEYNDVDGFADAMSAMQKGKTLTTLNAIKSFNGNAMTVKESIRARIANGATITIYDGKRILENPDESFIDESKLTKTGMDYAEFLISKKPVAEAQGVDEVEDDKKPKQKTSTSPLDEFESSGGEAWQVTRSKWVEIMQGHMAMLGQSEDDHVFEAFHKSQVKDALDAGKLVPPEVLMDYPDMKPETQKEKDARYADAENAMKNIISAAAGEKPSVDTSLSALIQKREAEIAAVDAEHDEIKAQLGRELAALDSKITVVRNKKEKKDDINNRAAEARRDHSEKVRGILNAYDDVIKIHPEELARKADSARKTAEMKAQIEAEKQAKANQPAQAAHDHADDIAFMQSVIDGKADIWASDLAGKLEGIYGRIKGDPQLEAQCMKAINAYATQAMTLSQKTLTG